MNTSTGYYDLFFRNFDPTLGRFMEVEPLASKYHNQSTYQYGNNDPVYWSDPSGAGGDTPSSSTWLNRMVTRLMNMAPANGGDTWTADGGFTSGYGYSTAMAYGTMYQGMFNSGNPSGGPGGGVKYISVAVYVPGKASNSKSPGTPGKYEYVLQKMPRAKLQGCANCVIYPDGRMGPAPKPNAMSYEPTLSENGVQFIKGGRLYYTEDYKTWLRNPINPNTYSRITSILKEADSRMKMGGFEAGYKAGYIHGRTAAIITGLVAPLADDQGDKYDLEQDEYKEGFKEGISFGIIDSMKDYPNILHRKRWVPNKNEIQYVFKADSICSYATCRNTSNFWLNGFFDERKGIGECTSSLSFSVCGLAYYCVCVQYAE